MATRDTILYHVDKGIPLHILLEDMARGDVCEDECTPHDREATLEVIRAMVDDGTLAIGRLQGSSRPYVVVTEWMPNTAAQLGPCVWP